MTHDQLAAQAWQLLVGAARNQQVLSYASLGKEIGVPAKGTPPILDLVEKYCKAKRFPHLTAIVVSQTTGVPGFLFPGYDDAEKNKEALRKPGLHAMRILREQARTFVFDWTQPSPPSASDFAGLANA